MAMQILKHPAMIFPSPRKRRKRKASSFCLINIKTKTANINRAIRTLKVMNFIFSIPWKNQLTNKDCPATYVKPDRYRAALSWKKGIAQIKINSNKKESMVIIIFVDNTVKKIVDIFDCSLLSD